MKVKLAKSDAVVTLNSTYLEVVSRLSRAQWTSPHLEADWILEKYLAVRSLDRHVTPERKVDSKESEKIFAACERRLLGEPLAYILNERDFYGLKFFVNEDVLIPRPETELLSDWAIHWARQKGSPCKEPLQILDLGAGSGCLGLSILKSLNSAHLTMIDISLKALQVAKKNAENLGLIERTNIIEMDARGPSRLTQKFDLILANPPYISLEDESIDLYVKKYEPQVALFSGDMGMQHIKDWSQSLPQILKPNGAVVFEIGSTQGVATMKVFEKLGVFKKLQLHKDYSGHDRFVSGES